MQVHHKILIADLETNQEFKEGKTFLSRCDPYETWVEEVPDDAPAKPAKEKKSK